MYMYLSADCPLARCVHKIRGDPRGVCSVLAFCQQRHVRASCDFRLKFLVQLIFCARETLKMAKFALVVFLFIILQVISVHALYTEDKCIKGEWHKASPSPETAEFKTCHAFKDSSCCTAKFTVELMANETRNLYNHSWHRCGQLSKKCQQFWVKQVHFVQP